MAGIVAQMTKANWERRKNAGKTIRAEKSNLYIPPFDRNFDPNRHNRYVSRKRGAPHRNKENDIEKVSDAETDDIEAEAAQMEREDSAAMAKRLRIEKKMAEEKYKADWLKAAMGCTVLSVPTFILLFFFFTFWLADTPKKLESGTLVSD